MPNNDTEDILNQLLADSGSDEGSAAPVTGEAAEQSEAPVSDSLFSDQTAADEADPLPEQSEPPLYEQEGDASQEIPPEAYYQDEPYGQEDPYYGGQREMPRKRKKSKKKKKRSRLPGVLILTTFIFAVSICLSLVIIAFGKDMLGIGKSDATKLIVIPEGATTAEISTMLKNEGIIKSPEFFQLFSRLRKSDSLYIPGEHFVRPNMPYETLIIELTTTKEEEQETVEVTFPEGITLFDAAQLLESENVCKADEFIFYFNSGGFGFDFESKLPTDTSLKFYRMEGYLFPDTYYFYTNMKPEQVCQKIYLNFDNKMTDDRYKRMEELGITLDQLITLASIVQKEAANTSTMTLVASVFWNRLENKDEFPLLQSDPTSNYANDVVKAKMDVYDQTIVEAYDTYKGHGLPPGAICNPGIEAIDAVLEKFESDYFYFIANVNTGQTYFSETLEEHEEYQAKVEQQYIDEKLAEEE